MSDNQVKTITSIVKAVKKELTKGQEGEKESRWVTSMVSVRC